MKHEYSDDFKENVSQICKKMLEDCQDVSTDFDCLKSCILTCSINIMAFSMAKCSGYDLKNLGPKKLLELFDLELDFLNENAKKLALELIYSAD